VTRTTAEEYQKYNQPEFSSPKKKKKRDHWKQIWKHTKSKGISPKTENNSTTMTEKEDTKQLDQS
jgi:hypothetical protein